MDSKSCHSSGDSSTATTSSNNSSTNRDQYLRHLNNISHKISKPIIRKPPFHHNNNNPPINHRPPAPPPPPPPPPQNLQQQQQPQHQPPVYNINKSDFRDVVQKLTGSPAHDRFSTPPPIQPPKPPSSRLQRIRPPPLAQITNRPPPPQPLLSPLPPFPAVHAAAESPISAYMRYLQGSTPIDSDPKRFPTLSPRWNNQYQNNLQPSASSSVTQSQYVIPTSPGAFGCLPSPRSPYPLFSPSMLFSPTSAGQLGFQPFPVSPRLPIASPRWKDL